MAEPPDDDYDDAMLDELMMGGGDDYAEPSTAELEMEFELEQEMAGELPAAHAPASALPPGFEPVPEPEQSGGMEVEEEEQEPPPPPAEVKARFAIPDADGEVHLLDAPPRQPRKLVPPSGSLLARPIASLIQDLERQAAFDQEAEAHPPPPPPPATPAARAAGGAAEVSQLWVDKYAPRAFVELLSDERLNRQVLRWIKQWDPLVFGTPAPPPAEARQGGWTSGGGGWSAGGAPGAHAGANNPAAGGGRGGGASKGAKAPPKRPERPLLLIAGPPGLGKTTLAHVAAVHAGYRTIEINSSDDRTAKVLRQRIKDATEVQSAFGTFSDRPEMARPVCVILDEIDGAMGGADSTSAITELVRMATGAGKGEGGGEDKEKEAKGLLQRPVICVCNELHAPILRPLRQVAEVVEFKGITNAQLSTRLKKVCTHEGLKAEANTLAVLATVAQNDVRACLNTLQARRRTPAPPPPVTP